MSAYSHLTQEERYHIEIQRKQNISLGKIAAEMNRSKATISREIRRNTGQRGYRYQQANRLAQQRHADKPKSINDTRINGLYWQTIAGTLEP